MRNIKGKPYYIPDKIELLKYADDHYFEMTPQLNALKNFVLKELCKDKELVDYLIDDIQLNCSMEAPLQETMSEFERRGITFKDKAQLNKLMPLIMDVYNHTRIWSNCGHTPKEMRDSDKSEIKRIGLIMFLVVFYNHRIPPSTRTGGIFLSRFFIRFLI